MQDRTNVAPTAKRRAALFSLVAAGAAIWCLVVSQPDVGTDCSSDQSTSDVDAVNSSALWLLYEGLGPSSSRAGPMEDGGPQIPADHPLGFLMNSTVAVDIRVPADLEARLPILDEPSFRPSVLSAVWNVSEKSVVRHELLSLLRRSGDPELDEILFGLLVDPAESTLMRSYAAQHLAINLENNYQPELVDRKAILHRALISDPEIMVRREALLGLARANDASALALIHSADAPVLTGMDDLVLAIWQEKNWRELAPRVVEYLDHQDEMAVVASVALIATWHIDAGRHRLASHALEGRRSPRIDRAVGLALRRFDDVRGSP